jgi:hypothetical protein
LPIARKAYRNNEANRWSNPESGGWETRIANGWNHLTRPSTTIILGQNSPDISNRVWEICDLFIGMEIDTLTVTNHWNMIKSLTARNSLREKSRGIFPKMGNLDKSSHVFGNRPPSQQIYQFIRILLNLSNIYQSGFSERWGEIVSLWSQKK